MTRMATTARWSPRCTPAADTWDSPRRPTLGPCNPLPARCTRNASGRRRAASARWSSTAPTALNRAFPLSQEDGRLAAQQFWYAQRVWPRNHQLPAACPVNNREVDSHELAYMSSHPPLGGTPLFGYKEVPIGSTYVFKARVPTLASPFRDLPPLQASALSQSFQLHVTDQVADLGCPWCTYSKEDLPSGTGEFKRLAALWHLMAVHPREYSETLYSIFQAPELPARAQQVPPMAEADWSAYPEQFEDYVRGDPIYSRPSKRASGSQSSSGSAGTTRPQAMPPPRLPPVAEVEAQNEAHMQDEPVVDV